jgi:hypothetical protein
MKPKISMKEKSIMEMVFIIEKGEDKDDGDSLASTITPSPIPVMKQLMTDRLTAHG